jgi:pimeloyl-ACP methyl ester carboxylesterase
MTSVHLVVIKDSSHVSWVDAPEEFPELLAKALRSTIQCR